MRMLTYLIFGLSFSMLYINPIQGVEFREVFVEVEGANIFCKVIGEGDPIVILHGGPGLAHDYLIPGFLKLAETNLLVFYDQRGTGLSTGEINKDTMRTDFFVKDLESLRKAFNFNQMILIGHSFGVFLSVNYALNYPERVSKLIAINSAPLSTDGFVEYGWRSMRNQKGEAKELSAIEMSPEFIAGEAHVLERYMRLAAKGSLYDPKKIELINFPTSLKRFYDYQKVLGLFSDIMLRKFDLFDSLRCFQFPVLIMFGVADSMPFTASQKMQENIPNSKLIIFEKSGHYIPMEQPEEMIELIQSFLFE